MKAEKTGWEILNDRLRSATEEEARSILQEELKGNRRMQFLMRIHSRLNKVRAIRERAELRGKAK